MVVELIKKFLKQLTENHIRIKGLNYTDKSIGLRVPDSPTGLLLQDFGIVQLYSARSKLILTAKGQASLSAAEITMNGSVDIQTPHITEFKINGKHFNPSIFEGNPVPIILNMNDNYFLSSTSKVVGDKVTNLTPLNKVMIEAKLFEEPQYIDTLEIEKVSNLGKAIRVELPKWTE